jgi:serine/threonine protein kinase/tetratricopeptide (TPR) repeat protein
MSGLPGQFTQSLEGRYTLTRQLGAGGMATVYLAHDVRNGRQVAIKVLREHLAATLGPERFLQEIRTTARLQHPHILPLLDSGEAAGQLFYVMPYVAGETLRARLERERTLPVNDVVRLTSQVASALESAHRAGVIHRDIKPENILLSEGLPLIADFGIAVAVAQAVDERMTATGSAIGTPAYMSPEQVLATGEIDACTDQYSLACIVFEAIAGQPPFRAATAFATMTEHVNGPIPRLTSPAAAVPPGVVVAVRRALAKRPADRFASVADFAAALSAAVERTSAVTAIGSRDEKSIVVLPFDNLSPDPGDSYLADGLTEELTADLARIRALRVTARNSAVAAKTRTRDVREIARLLGTRYVLEGSVRRAGPALRITAQLIDGATDAQLWSEKFNGSMDDVFAMQERISREIVEALAMKLSPEEQRSLEEHPVTNLEAYQLYLRVGQCLKEMTGESLARARELLDRALALEGENDVLLGLYGVLELMSYSLGFDGTNEALRRGDEFATRALTRNPRSAMGLHAKAILAEKTDLGRSVRYLRESVSVKPNAEAIGLLAFGLAMRGEERDAMEFARRAMAIDPLSPAVAMFVMGAAWHANAATQALAWADAARRVAPDNPTVQFLAGYLLVVTGQRDAGLTLLDQAAASQEGTFFQVMPRMLGQALRGEPLLPLPEVFRPVIARDPHGSHMLGEIYAAAGERDEALGWLGNAVRLGVVNVRYMTEQSPFFASLRDDPAFQALIVDARARAARETTGSGGSRR